MPAFGIEATTPLPVWARPKRTILVVPAIDPRKLAKAATLPADELIIDLEDSVAEGAKDSARRAALEFLAGPGRTRGVGVRVNSIMSDHGKEDLRAIIGAAEMPRTLVLPKVERPAQVGAADRVLRGAGASTSLQALIETPAALGAIQAIAGASPRLEGLVIGYEDLSAALGRASVEGNPELWLAVQDRVLVAARAHDLDAIDGPSLYIDDEEGLRQAGARAHRLGFDGKWVIHPAQLAPIRESMRSSAEDQAHARAVASPLGRGRAGARAPRGRPPAPARGETPSALRSRGLDVLVEPEVVLRVVGGLDARQPGVV